MRKRTPSSSAVKRLRNWLDVLKACPVPMDDLPPRSGEYFRNRKL
jgi:hypothetical protein